MNPTIDYLDPGRALAATALEMDDLAMARRVAADVEAGRLPDGPSVTETLRELHEATEQEAEQQELAEALDAHVPWHLAPAFTWAITLLMRPQDGALEAFWFCGEKKLPAYELGEDEAHEFVMMASMLQPGIQAAFHREYGRRMVQVPVDHIDGVVQFEEVEEPILASPWDYHVAVFFQRWFRAARQATVGDWVLRRFPDGEEVDLGKPDLQAAKEAKRGLVPHSLTVGVRTALVASYGLGPSERFYHG